VTAIAENLVDRAKRVELVVLDVDGVLTDGRLVYAEEGEAPKRFHAHDGLGIRLLHESGIEVAIVTARGSKPLERRVAELKIRHFQPDARDKLAAVQGLARELGLELDQICFAGDDVLDLPAMGAVGLAASVADAHPAARNAAHWVSERNGNLDIYTVTAFGGAVETQLTVFNGTDMDPNWAPDGNKIAFISTRGGSGAPNIFVMNADGSDVTALTEGSFNTSPQWSPDGRLIAFISLRDGNPEIYVMNADGSNQTRLTNNPGSDGHHRWCPIPIDEM
jgi:3-deoxy-D-manno-octulosonate 8-phosphate phosphatase (KDO 8-P phosphatase)